QETKAPVARNRALGGTGARSSAPQELQAGAAGPVSLRRDRTRGLGQRAHHALSKRLFFSKHVSFGISRSDLSQDGGASAVRYGHSAATRGTRRCTEEQRSVEPDAASIRNGPGCSRR